jgi:copper chaperone CopZ
MPHRARRIAAAAALAALVALCWACGGNPDAADFPVERGRCTVVVAVPNMACETACPIKVRALLGDVEGVQSVDVSFEERRATVEGVWPACGHDGFRKMLANLRTRGYEGQIVSSQ